MWCQGKVVDFIRESKEKHVFVKIEWSVKCVREGDLKSEKPTEKDEMKSELTRCWSLARGFIS